jgi:hypothetical protein
MKGLDSAVLLRFYLGKIVCRSGGWSMEFLWGLVILIFIGGIAYQSLSPEHQLLAKVIGTILLFGIAVRIVWAFFIVFLSGGENANDARGNRGKQSSPRYKGQIRTNRGPVLSDGLSLKFEIDYTDAYGQSTSRLVTIRAITGTLHRDGSISLEGFSGYCHLRNDERNFLFERVRAAGDPKTGEIVEDFRALVAYRSGRRERVR